jgi:hypothetical protein
MNTRRQFIQLSAGLAAAGVPLAAAAPLPTARLGKHEVSRLIIGSNPFYGYSHASRALDQHMREWGTPDHICAALQEAERNGINTFQTNGGDRAITDIRLYRERGGKLQVIALIKERPEDAVKNLRPIALSHHGEATDVLFREKRMDEVREFTKRVRQAGVLVGVSTHKPGSSSTSRGAAGTWISTWAALIIAPALPMRYASYSANFPCLPTNSTSKRIRSACSP